MNRQVFEIASEIKKDWATKINYGAKPYLDAMECLQTVESSYGADNGKGIICYFLANAGTWRGEVAKRVKAELKKMVGLK